MTRVECMHRAAVIEHEARVWDRIDPRLSVSARQDRDDWRAAGKAIPRRRGALALLARQARAWRRRLGGIRDPKNAPKMRLAGICKVGVLERRGYFEKVRTT